jgi:hypothetical protein
MIAGLDFTDAKVTGETVAAAGAVLAALLALMSALVVNWITKRTKDKELFQSALEFLTGGTQKRSVGISIIRNYAEQHSKRDVASRIFVAQMLHLYDEGYGRTIDQAALTTPPPRSKKKEEEDGPAYWRYIEQVNFYAMKDAVEEWNRFPKDTQAAQIACKRLGLKLRERRRLVPEFVTRWTDRLIFRDPAGPRAKAA